MKRLWVRWTALLLFVVIIVAAFIRLGEWQLARLDERRAKNAAVIANSQAAPVPYQQVFDHPVGEAQQWQRVTVTGTYDAEHQIQVRYRPNGGQSNTWEVITPLRTEQGQAVLINRGWVAVPQGTRVPDALPAPPAGPVTVTGYVRRDENGKPKAIDPVNNQVRLVNSVAIEKTLGYPVVDGYVALIESQPTQDPQFNPYALPGLDEGPHFSYAMQWFAFAVIGVGGLFVLIRSDVKERRKKREEDAEAAASEAPAAEA